MAHSRTRLTAIVATIAILLVIVSQAGKAQRRAATPPRNPDADWPMYNRDLGGTRYSPLTQINTTNVEKLTKAWSFRLPPETPLPASRTPSGTEVFQEVTPIVVNGVMYMPVGGRVVALEPESGKEIWTHELKEGLASFRGVTYWPGEGTTPPRIIFTSLKKLVALNALTGEPASGFGNNGEVDMVVGYAGVPIVYKNIIFVGSTIYGPGERHIDSGVTPVGPPLNPRAFDARTGAKLWEFNTVPKPGEFGNETWANGSWKDRTGVNVWAFTLTLDERRGTVFLPVGGPNYNYYGGNRPGDNLFANTLVAIDGPTGKRKWHFQTVHHELWDFDLPPAPMLFDLVKDGRTIPALVQTGKLGYMFILNRETGAPVYPIEERPVPKGNAPGEVYAPTQPIPVKPAPIARVSMSAADLVTAADTTPSHAQACKELWDTVKYYNDGPYSPWQYREAPATPERGAGRGRGGGPPAPLPPGTPPPTIVFPGATGGPNWGGTALDKRTNYIFIATKDAPAIGWIAKNPQYSEATKDTQQPFIRVGGPNLSAPAMDENGRSYGNLPCFRPPWSSLVAVNANTGDIAWKVPLGINTNMPEGKNNVGNAGCGGPIATAGGLVFIGATSDNRFRAFDSRTGKELWSTKVDNNITATPMTYQGKDGKQYVAVVSASGGGNNQSLLVFSLP